MRSDAYRALRRQWLSNVGRGTNTMDRVDTWLGLAWKPVFVAVVVIVLLNADAIIAVFKPLSM